MFSSLILTSILYHILTKMTKCAILLPSLSLGISPARRETMSTDGRVGIEAIYRKITAGDSAAIAELDANASITEMAFRRIIEDPDHPVTAKVLLQIMVHSKHRARLMKIAALRLETSHQHLKGAFIDAVKSNDELANVSQGDKEFAGILAD